MAGRARLIQTNGSGGEISRAARARPDVDAYSGAFEKEENYITRPSGAMDRRGGTVKLGHPKNNAAGKRWFVLKKSIVDVVRIEAGAGVFRFWNGQTRALISVSGTPVEVAIPWSDAELAGVRYCQEGDVMYFSHVSHAHKLKVLKRTSSTSFTLTDASFEEGPFKQRSTSAPLLTFSGVSGSVTVSAASPVFNANMVGALIRVEATTQPTITSWCFDIPADVGDYCRNGNNIYVCTGANDPKKTGNSPPVHTEGAYWDGTSRDNILWAFQGYTYGLLRITNFGSATSVTATVLQRLPFYASDPKTSDYWQISALSTDEGWPAATTIFEDRFCAFGSTKDVQRFFSSRTNRWTPDNLDMRPGFPTETLDDDAIQRSLREGETAFIVWALVLDGLLLGTSVGVRQLSGPSVDEALTPAGTVPRTVTEIPCSPNMPPLKADNALIYSAVGDQELIEVSRARDSVPRNLLELAAHMCETGLRSYCWQGRPARALWAVTKRGRLRSMTYSPENSTYAWARHPLGGRYGKREPYVDDACSGPGPDGRDEVWLMVARTVNGATVRTVEYVAPTFDANTMRSEDACCVDAAFYIDLWQSYTVLATDLGEGRVRLTAQGGATPFVTGDLGRQFWMTGNDSEMDEADEPMPVKVSIDTRTSSSVIEGAFIGNFAEDFWKNRVLRVARPTTQISGLTWLEGELVILNADGRRLGPFAVTSGVINLVGADAQPAWMARGWGGLQMKSRIRSLPINGGEGLGSSRGAMGRVSGILVMPDGIADGRVRRADQSADVEIALNARSSSDPMGASVPIEEDDRWITLDAGYERGKQIEILADSALPASVAGFLLKVESYG